MGNGVFKHTSISHRKRAGDVSADSAVELGHARLTLRREHGLAVDRGRLVREALALVLADLETQGADSALVQRLLDE